jgi:tyrosyl-tRNA synthetase
MDVETKINIIKSFAEEIITEDELSALFESKSHPTAYDGFEPSGQIHIAQGLQRAITVNKLTSTGVHFKFWVADWFAMLNNKLGGDMEKIKITGEYFIEVWRACGMDLKNVEFIWTSKFINEHPEYWQTVLKLSMNTTVQRVLRCSQIMGREDGESNQSSQIMYPLMQAADMAHLDVDIAQLGLDQRKVNMLAREIFPKIGRKPPVAVHHHMLMGLKAHAEGLSGVEKKIEMKMSKSKPETAVFMTDTKEDIFRKFRNAYCPEGVEEDNPVLDYAKHLVFEKFESVLIKRQGKYGGDVEVGSYNELKELFVSKKLHPSDLKESIAEYTDQMVNPVREHFEKNKHAKELYDLVKGYKITR